MASVKRYKKEDIITYCLGATVSMEYLNIRPKDVKQIYLHSAFYESETKEKIQKICAERNIPCEVNDKVFQILSQKENCFVIAMIRKYTCELDKNASHVVLGMIRFSSQYCSVTTLVASWSISTCWRSMIGRSY